MVKLGPTSTGGSDDAICVYNAAGSINVLVDANGWFGSATATATPAGYQYQALAPTQDLRHPASVPIVRERAHRR